MSESESNTCEICGKTRPQPLCHWKPLNQLVSTKVEAPILDLLREAERKQTCTCNKPEPATQHDGDLGHNTTVFYSDEKYIADDGEVFFNKEVCLSDKMRHFCLIPKEALSLRDWLIQESPELERLAKEQASE